MHCNISLSQTTNDGRATTAKSFWDHTAAATALPSWHVTRSAWTSTATEAGRVPGASIDALTSALFLILITKTAISRRRSPTPPYRSRSGSARSSFR
ncbi:unnamed protein product [Linum trigynum]|uniref:Uncharacterized protein n=1 Tax=Linum trigynum TaxID=586398 RepID=A0AAV2GHF8_9ROSI